MYAVTGITGRVGGTIAHTLLGAGQNVRAVVRDEANGKPWADKGCEVAVADVGDSGALTAAFADANGVFLMMPPTTIRSRASRTRWRMPAPTGRRSRQPARAG
jgi:NAD(P)H dehydrogenase (quinone)